MMPIFVWMIALGSTFSSCLFALQLRTFRQYEAHLSSATGVSSSMYNIRLISREVRSGLAHSPDVEGFNGHFVRSSSHLAGAYCRETVMKESSQDPSLRVFHGPVDFESAPKHLSQDSIREVVRIYALRFWDRSIHPDEVQILWNLVDELKFSLPDTKVGTRDFFIAICTLMASSVESLVLTD